MVASSAQRIAACACLVSSTGAPVCPASLNNMPTLARADTIGVQAPQPRPTTRVSTAVVLDDRTVVEDRERGAFLRGAAEGLAVGVAQRIHDLMFVDDGAAQVRAPGAEHDVARSVEQEDRGTLEADLVAGHLHRPAQDRVAVVEREHVAERRQQGRQLRAHRTVHHLGPGRTRPRRADDQRPVHAAAAVHGRWKVDVRSWRLRPATDQEKRSPPEMIAGVTLMRAGAMASAKNEPFTLTSDSDRSKRCTR